MAIPISQSVIKASDRLLEVVTSDAFADDLDDRETDDYPLPVPETWVQARVNLSRHWHHLNVDEVMGVIHATGDATVMSDFSGTGNKFSRDQTIDFDVAIIAKVPASYPQVMTQGRPMIDDEWMNQRMERYRGALLDVIPSQAPSEDIPEIHISDHDVALFEIDGIDDHFAHANVRFSCYQNVSVKIA